MAPFCHNKSDRQCCILQRGIGRWWSGGGFLFPLCAPLFIFFLSILSAAQPPRVGIFRYCVVNTALIKILKPKTNRLSQDASNEYLRVLITQVVTKQLQFLHAALMAELGNTPRMHKGRTETSPPSQETSVRRDSTSVPPSTPTPPCSIKAVLKIRRGIHAAIQRPTKEGL